MLVQGVLSRIRSREHLFVFRGRTRANLIKITYWDGTGFYLFTNGSSTVSFCGREASSRTLTSTTSAATWLARLSALPHAA